MDPLLASVISTCTARQCARLNRRGAMRMLLAAGAAMVAPGAAAQSSRQRMPLIGYLGPSPDTAPQLLKAFQDGLAAFGYVDGRTVRVEYRWTNAGNDMTSEAQLTANARDLVARGVDVMVVSIDPAILAARKVAGSVPIVMLNVSDPVELRLVDSLAHPGGNITGMTRVSADLVGKNVEHLLELVPTAKRIALLLSSASGMAPLIARNAEQAARQRGVALVVVPVLDVRDLDGAIAALRRDHVDGLLVADTGGGVFWTQRTHLAALALAQRLPTVFANTENVDAGGLMSYSPSSPENYRRAAAFIDKILRGTKVGDIPVEQPTRFEMVVNLRTAKALNVAVPRSLLLRADRVIE